MKEEIFNLYDFILVIGLFVCILIIILIPLFMVNEDLAKQVEEYKTLYNEEKVINRILTEEMNK